MQYTIHDAVTYEGISYICIRAHTSTTATRPTGQPLANTWWDILALRGATGATGRAGRDGRDGLDGAEGKGFEYIYARTPFAQTSLAGKLPPDSWRYDQPGTVGGLRWYDGSPPPLAGGARSKVWWDWRRVLPSEAVLGRAVAGAWQHPPNPLVTDGEDAEIGSPEIQHSGQRGCITFSRLRICTDRLTGGNGTLSHTFLGAFRSPPFVQVTASHRARIVSVTATGFRYTISSPREDPGSLLQYTAFGEPPVS